MEDLKVSTRVLRVDPERVDPALIAEAARVIRKGGIVAFPTETVYGLGANAYTPRRRGKVFIAKRSPWTTPS
jgi:translation factor SUA5